MTVPARTSPRTRAGTDLAIRITASATVLALAGIAGAVSFRHALAV